MATYDIALFKGHGKGYDGSFDCGAVNGNDTEYNIVSQIVDVALGHLKSAGVNVLTGEQNYKNDLLAGHSVVSKCAYSVHINAGGGSRSEAYVPLKEKFFDTEIAIQKELAKLGIPDGGVRSRDYDTERIVKRTAGTPLSGTDYYKEIRQAWSKGISLTILEVGFIDSGDKAIIKANIAKIGLIIAQQLAKLCGKTISTPAPAPAPTTPSSGVKYRVVCGTFADKANAVAQQEKLKKAGFDSFLITV